MERVEFENSAEYVYPKFKCDFSDFQCFPQASDYDENDNNVIHPLVQVLRDGAKIDDVLIDDEFEDDGCPCVSLTITLANGDKYGISLWWLSDDGMYTIMGAERNKEEDIKELVNWISN